MPAPEKTLTNILVGLADFYISPTSTTQPPDDHPLGDDWSVVDPTWYHPGYSEDGLGFTVERKEERHRVEEISTPAAITIDESTLKVEFTFAEATLENLRYATGGGTITETAAAVGQIGKKELKLSEELDVVQIGFEGKNPDGFARRVIIPRVVSLGKINAKYNRSKSKQVFAAEFESVCAISDIVIYDKTANATS